MKSLFLLSIISLLVTTNVFSQSEIIADANNLIEAEQYKDAVILLEKGTSQYSDNEKLKELLGRSYLKTEKYSEAMDAFSDLTKMDKENAKYFYLLGASSYEALSNTSNIFKLSTYSSRMKSSLSKALELDPSHVEARIRLSNYYLNAPMIAGGSTKKALGHAEILIQYDKNAGYQLMASIHKSKEEYEQAEQIYLKMLDEGVEEKKIYYLLGVLKYDQGLYDSSIDYCEQSISLHPEYLTPYYQHAKSAVSANKELDKAMTYLKHFVENYTEGITPSLHWVHLRIGQIHQLNGNIEEARNEFNSALKLKPDFDAANKELKEL